MIQRIQSLYLLISTILGVVCLSMPLGYFCTAQGERISDLYNLWLKINETETHEFTWALFALLTGISALTFLNIFLFRRRALQMRVAVLCMILLLGYYAFFGVLLYIAHGNGYVFTPHVTAAFPAVCIILNYLAFRGILKDELLIKSLDRLR